MTFFTSEFECKIDAKGRLVLPAKIKGTLPESSGSELVIRKGFEPCLILYPMVEYKKLYSKIAGLNEFNAEYRKIQRQFFSGSSVVELDGTGRFLIPKLMMQHAGLEKNAVVVGMGNKIEIWNPEEYKKYSIGDPDEFSALAQKYLNE
ncbi:division/cell wall cluster transcriptional repressor MraZ [Fulvivirga sp. M361]|uniref:division/cell wall cluster transcriptional repressor MraZ n=1 Tax=Fulvivirga sp. M361 TaxID=2594266 RepID=UPI00117B3B24|nr:division/cell wall cluster transcriptional repressor MraZ [Fulvivirga sp. M361]TRX54276.1 division/cell wall cluster transcriptional repressor MraZ [Fulvivirga sp. M361]